MKSPKVVIVMGVAGCGKSTVGALLASRNGGTFHDADDFHPVANVAKMASGIPLDDADRAPWLARMRGKIIDATPAGSFAVLACSALKKSYRQQLGGRGDGVAFVYLRGTPDLLAKRLAARRNHFMKPGMLESQLATLEEPAENEAFIVDISEPVGEIVTAIETALGLRFPS